jgi:RNA polymerase sigma factor (sigma-70 family)
MGVTIKCDGTIVQLVVSWKETGKDEYLEKIQIWSYFWIKKYFLRKYIREQMHKPSDVEEIIEHAYLKFNRYFDKVREPERYISWLKTICQNEMAEYYKTKKNTSETLNDFPDYIRCDNSEEIFRDFENEESIKQLFCKIRKIVSPAEAEVVYKKIIENKTNSSIGEELNINEQSVKNHYYRAIEKMRNSYIINNLLKKKVDRFY